MTDRPEVGKWPWREDGGHAQAEEVEGWDVGYSITNKAPREDGLCWSRSVQHRINGMASHRYAAVRCAVHVHNTFPSLIFVVAIHVLRNAEGKARVR